MQAYLILRFRHSMRSLSASAIISGLIPSILAEIQGHGVFRSPRYWLRPWDLVATLLP